MRRSEINHLLEEAKAFLVKHSFPLPPWAFWPPDEWRMHHAQCAGIVSRHLGWDITDFGSTDFARRGLLLFTLRNGGNQSGGDSGGGGKPYAEKIMIVREGQKTPWHFHRHKMEDIINRGGGDLVLEVAPSTPDARLGDGGITVCVDEVPRHVVRGQQVVLTPGESITLDPGVYHRFFAQPTRGAVLAGEVSTVNDDATDNCFLDTIARFPAIIEDAPSLHPLVGDYGTLFAIK